MCAYMSRPRSSERSARASFSLPTACGCSSASGWALRSPGAVPAWLTRSCAGRTGGRWLMTPSNSPAQENATACTARTCWPCSRPPASRCGNHGQVLAIPPRWRHDSQDGTRLSGPSSTQSAAPDSGGDYTTVRHCATAPLRRWIRGRLTLLGDAAHPMLPYLAQGVNQAIEDGVALATMLAVADRPSVPRALLAYETLRRDRTARIQQDARQNGAIYDNSGNTPGSRHSEPGVRLPNRRWIYDYDIQTEAAPVAAALANR